MADEKKNIAENAIEKWVDKPKKAENAEGSFESQNIRDLIKLDEHLAKKQTTDLKPPYGMKSAVCVPGRNYG